MGSKELQEKLQVFFRESMRITVQYFKAKLIISLILAVVAGGIFSLLDIPLYGLFGAVFGISNLVPVFGSLIASIIICVVLLFIKPILALYVLFVILGLQILEQFILTPLIMGKAIELKPLVIIGVVMAAGIFAGFWGMLFALPIAASIKIAYDIFVHNTPVK